MSRKAIPAPKRKLVADAARISPTLPPLSEVQMRAAKYKHGQLWRTTQNTIFCTHCGTEFPAGDYDPNRVYTCPKCGSKSRVSQGKTKKQNEHLKYYCTLTAVREGYQIIRTFYCEKKMKRQAKFFGETYQEASFEFHCTEVSQWWLTPDGKYQEFITRRNFSSVWYQDIWDPDSMMEHRNTARDAYFLTGYALPGCRLIPEVRRNGMRRVDDDFNIGSHIRNLLTDPLAESLQKHGWKAMLLLYLRDYRSADVTLFESSIRIAMRHGLKVTDARLYLDYLQDCARLGYDLHNPKYICVPPGELKARHQTTQERIRKIDAKLEAERERQQRLRDAQAIAEYNERMRAYMGVCLKSGKLVITPLMTVDDVCEEGEKMHHCVFQNAYYKDRNALLMSARVDGEREETVEFNLTTGTVEQSRSYCNGRTVYHSEIITLVEANAARLMALSKMETTTP